MFSGALSISSFGPGFVPISSCTVQDEDSLSCSQITDTSCDHSMDLGVVCDEPSATATTNLPPVSTDPPLVNANSQEVMQTGSSPTTSPEATGKIMYSELLLVFW